MDKSIERKISKVKQLVQGEKHLGITEAIEKVKNYDLDNNGELYDADTGETICDIEIATDEQVRILLQTKKRTLCRGFKNKISLFSFYMRMEEKSNREVIQ